MLCITDYYCILYTIFCMWYTLYVMYVIYYVIHLRFSMEYVICYILNSVYIIYYILHSRFSYITYYILYIICFLLNRILCYTYTYIYMHESLSRTRFLWQDPHNCRSAHWTRSPAETRSAAAAQCLGVAAVPRPRPKHVHAASLRRWGTSACPTSASHWSFGHGTEIAEHSPRSPGLIRHTHS